MIVLVVIPFSNWPLILLFALYGICLLITLQELVFVFHKHQLKKHLLKKAFLILLAVFLLFRTFLLVVPLPYNATAYYIVCDQVPNYFMFLAWEFLAVWLGKAVLIPSRTQKQCNIIPFLTLFLLAAFLAVLGISLALAFVSAV